MKEHSTLVRYELLGLLVKSCPYKPIPPFLIGNFRQYCVKAFQHPELPLQMFRDEHVRDFIFQAIATQQFPEEIEEEAVFHSAMLNFLYLLPRIDKVRTCTAHVCQQPLFQCIVQENATKVVLPESKKKLDDYIRQIGLLTATRLKGIQEGVVPESGSGPATAQQELQMLQLTLDLVGDSFR